MKYETTTIEIDGMSCGHCVQSVRTELEGIDGVTVNSVGVGSASITCDVGLFQDGVIAAAIEEAGFSMKSHHPAVVA